MRATILEADADHCTFEVAGRPRGLLAQPHVHTRQTETIEVLSGALRVNDRVLGPGETIEIPPGTPHTQQPAAPGEGVVRITHRPAGRTPAFLAGLGDLEVNRFGFPRLRSGVRFMRAFGADHRPALPPARPYEFVDEWDVAAPIEAVFDVLEDARTYPEWWKPVYLAVEGSGDEFRQHFKGRLPYHLHTRTRRIRNERPHVLDAEIDGDLRGRGTWLLSEVPGGTHVRFEWRVSVGRPLLHVLTPLLRPALRWNHAWAIARAIEGLEPYARMRSERTEPGTAAMTT